MSYVVRLIKSNSGKYIYQVSYWDPERTRWIGVENFDGASAKAEAFEVCHYLNGGGTHPPEGRSGRTR